MDEVQFRDSLRLGLGRAIVYARNHDVRKFREAILDACLHCKVYDRQLERSRAPYMCDLAGSLPDKDFYYGEVLKSLPGSGDDWDAAHRFAFAACLAFDGDEKAKRAIVRKLPPRAGDGRADRH